jgi:hypothetical protein
VPAIAPGVLGLGRAVFGVPDQHHGQQHRGATREFGCAHMFVQQERRQKRGQHRLDHAGNEAAAGRPAEPQADREGEVGPARREQPEIEQNEQVGPAKPGHGREVQRTGRHRKKRQNARADGQAEARPEQGVKDLRDAPR